MKARINIYISLIILAIVFHSCSQKLKPISKSKAISGIYKNNISPFGLTSTRIVFFANGTCDYENSRHMQETFRLNGKYSTSGKTLYIRFEKPKQLDTIKTVDNLLTWTIVDEYDSYELKRKNNIEYHCKYLMENEKLYVYRFDNGKLVREAKHYSDEKGRHMAPFYLEKTSE